MTAQPLPALTSGDPSAWDQALYAFLIEKGNRSGSRRTVESYSRMLWPAASKAVLRKTAGVPPRGLGDPPTNGFVRAGLLRGGLARLGPKRTARYLRSSDPRTAVMNSSGGR